MRRLHFVLAGFLACAACGGGEGATLSKHTSVLKALGGGPEKAPPKAPPRADANLLPRRVLFANPDRTAPSLSPDGKRLAWLADVDGVLNVWVAPSGDLAAAKAVTKDKKRGIRGYRWAYTNEHILYAQDEDGDENWRVYAADLKKGAINVLTPEKGVQARIEGVSHLVPGAVIVGLNDRDKRHHDLYRIELASPDKRTLLQKNEAGYARFELTDDLKVRFALQPMNDGGTKVLEPDGKGAFTIAFEIPHEDALTTRIAGFDKETKKAFLFDSRGRDTSALVELDLATKKTKVILDDGQADIESVLRHPTQRHVQAALASYDRLRWHILDPALRADLETMKTARPGADVGVQSRTLDDTKWLFAAYVTDGSTNYYVYDRTKKTNTFLFTNTKALEDKKLAPMHPRFVKARDGLELSTYLTLPASTDPDADGVPDKPLPMVLLVHGGPWARDEWGFNKNHQWLASRGYAVLSVNYRGSTGFGKKFVNAADKEWAGKAHEDLLDAVAWATGQKIADKSKIAIFGGSYGGYATLVGLTFTPETFACGVDIVGPSSLVTLLQSIPPYWESEIERFAKRIGDHRTEEGKKFLLSRSPITKVDQIKRPLLIGQGANDPRVKQAESDTIVKAMQSKSIPVTYVLYPDEGHGFARPENRTSFNAIAEIFLADCLGGSYEPIGRDFEGSSLTVPAGKEAIPTLGENLH